MSKPPGTRKGADRDLAATLVVVEQLKPALEKDDRARQVAAVRRLIDMRAPMGGQWEALAGLAARNGEISLARAAIDLFVEARGGAPAARYAKGSLLAEAGAHRDGYALLRSLPEDFPDRATHAYSRGTLALYMGRMDEAREQLERATELQPRMGPAWLALAKAANLAAEPELAARIVAAQRTMDVVPPADRAPYLYALGEAHAALGDHRSAFAAFERAGRDVQVVAPYNQAADRRGAEEALRGFDAESVAALAHRQDEPAGRAMFVTGLPRTGTTLVEQILTAHSAVSDGGEINLLMQLAREMRGQSCGALAAHVEARGGGGIARLWAHLLQERFPAPGRVVDKSLNTTRFLGLAATLLPDAPLVWLTRDPLDCAWSCFRTYFRGAQLWSSDLEDIAHHFRLENELLQRWQDILGERLLIVPYEEIVADPQASIRRIAAHCGLDEEPGMFAPHENARAVATNSVAQVRRPINRQGIGTAEPYREFLAPLVVAFSS